MDIARIIDHTNLEASATAEDIKKTCQEAKEYGFRSVCINPRWIKLAKEELSGTNIKVVTVIDWPVGASSTKARVCEAEAAKTDGADEIDPVLDIGDFKAGNYDLVLEDLKALAKILPTKLIIETGYLTDEEIKKAASLVKEAGCYCVKTSTGTPPKVEVDTKIHHIELIREAVGPDFPIKAAGGIRTMEDAKRVVEAGANIIGTSSGVEIMTGSEPKEGGE
jgi:deoxyribose-phosphate aldolase